MALATLAAALLHGPALAGLGIVGAYLAPMLVTCSIRRPRRQRTAADCYSGGRTYCDSEGRSDGRAWAIGVDVALSGSAPLLTRWLRGLRW